MSERPSPIDPATLFWWTRNQLDFQQHLGSDERIRTICYDQACNSPRNIAEAIAELAGIALPARSIASRVRPQPEVHRETDLHPDVEKLCQKTWDSFAGCPEL